MGNEINSFSQAASGTTLATATSISARHACSSTPAASAHRLGLEGLNKHPHKTCPSCGLINRPAQARLSLLALSRPATRRVRPASAVATPELLHHNQHLLVRADRNNSAAVAQSPAKPAEQAQSAVQPAAVSPAPVAAQVLVQPTVASQTIVQPAVTADPVVQPVVAVNPVVDPTVTANPVVNPVVNANPTTDVTNPTTATNAATVTATNEPTTTSTNSYTGGTGTVSATGPQTTLGSVTGTAGGLTATGPVNTVYANRGSALCIQAACLVRLALRMECSKSSHVLDRPMISLTGHAAL